MVDRTSIMGHSSIYDNQQACRSHNHHMWTQVSHSSQAKFTTLPGRAWKTTRRTVVLFCIGLSLINFSLITMFTMDGSQSSSVAGRQELPDAEFIFKENTFVNNELCETHGAATDPFPKRIHQIWTTTDVPDKWRILQQHCQFINPEYEYNLWTHADIEIFLKEHYPWFMDTYTNYPFPVERLDAARYFILYHFGGVYIDMDMECKVQFNDMIKHVTNETGKADIVLGATAPMGVTSSFLVAKPLHPFMKYMTGRLRESNRWYVLPYWTVVLSTGPLYVWKSYLNYPCRDQIHVLSVYLHTQVYLDHKHASTWHSWDGPIMVFFDHHWCAIIIIASIVILYVSIALRHKRAKQRRQMRITTVQI